MVFSMCQGRKKHLVLSDGHPPFIGNPYNGALSTPGNQWELIDPIAQMATALFQDNNSKKPLKNSGCRLFFRGDGLMFKAHVGG